MTVKLIVTESDNGDSLTLPGEWSCESVEYDDNENSVTTYAYEALDSSQMKSYEKVLDDAEGVINYMWIRSVGRPPAAGKQRQTRISATVPPEYKAWLEQRGDFSIQIRAMIKRAMQEQES